MVDIIKTEPIYLVRILAKLNRDANSFPSLTSACCVGSKINHCLGSTVGIHACTRTADYILVHVCMLAQQCRLTMELPKFF